MSLRCGWLQHKSFSLIPAWMWLFLVATLGVAWFGNVQMTQASIAWPLKVSRDGRHLVDQKDQPFLYTADTSWTMLSMLTVDDAKHYIDLRKAQGFNTIQTIFTGWRRGGRGPRGAFFQGGDVTQPNASFFSGVDEIMVYAQSQDMLLSAVVLWLADNGGWSGGTAVPKEQFTQYVTWLAQRYRHQGNLIWVFGGDEEISVQTDTTKAGALALLAAHPQALITYHPRSKAFDLKSESWLAYHSFQWNANSSPYTYQDVRRGYELTPIKPILDAEPAYDPKPASGKDLFTTPYKVRRNGWWAILSGAMGVVYGGPRETWNIGASGTPNWTAVMRPAAAQTGYIRAILEPLPWSKLIPDFSKTVITGGGQYGQSDYVAAGAASDGSLIAAYTPVATTLQVELSRLIAPGTMQWFDPVSGKAYGPAEPVTNHGKKSFTTPGQNSGQENDWILIIKTEQR